MGPMLSISYLQPKCCCRSQNNYVYRIMFKSNLAKWLSVRLRTKWLQVRVQLHIDFSLSTEILKKRKSAILLSKMRSLFSTFVPVLTSLIYLLITVRKVWTSLQFKKNSANRILINISIDKIEKQMANKYKSSLNCFCRFYD